MKKNYAFLSILMGLSLCSWADSRPAFLSENLGLKHSVYKQETIRGLVQSSTGESIAGASIRNLSTGSTVQTDAEGRFEIAGQVGQQLRISIIGYETQTLTISSS